MVQFARMNGSEASGLQADHHGSEEGMFLYAGAGPGAGPASTWVITQDFNGENHIVECFQFWFYIDGFMVKREHQQA